MNFPFDPFAPLDPERLGASTEVAEPPPFLPEPYVAPAEDVTAAPRPRVRLRERDLEVRPPPPDAAAPEGAPTADLRAAQRVAGASVLRAQGLVKAFKRRRVVDDVDLRLEQGEIVGLLGPNGAGKTTTFYMIVGLISADEGKVFLDERDITSVPMYRRARDGIGYLSQEPSVFRRLSVRDNVMAILETLDLAPKEAERQLEQLLDELGLAHLRDQQAYALSGGERRRLEITRALVTNPKFMLLDEPFAGVDPIAVDDIQRIVAELRARKCEARSATVSVATTASVQRSRLIGSSVSRCVVPLRRSATRVSYRERQTVDRRQAHPW